MRRVAWCAPLVALLALLPWPSAAQEKQQPLRFLGELDIPDQSIQIDGTTVGGLSGLAYDARRGVYYIISDDRGDFGPARFYTARISLGLDGVRDVQFIGTTLLDSDAATPGIQPYAQNDSDTEEILLLPDDTLLISSERDRNNVPWLRRFALDGSLLGGLADPGHVHSGVDRRCQRQAGPDTRRAQQPRLRRRHPRARRERAVRHERGSAGPGRSDLDAVPPARTSGS